MMQKLKQIGSISTISLGCIDKKGYNEGIIYISLEFVLKSKQFRQKLEHF
jgi:hypothetical protein